MKRDKQTTLWQKIKCFFGHHVWCYSIKKMSRCCRYCPVEQEACYDGIEPYWMNKAGEI